MRLVPPTPPRVGGILTIRGGGNKGASTFSRVALVAADGAVAAEDVALVVAVAERIILWMFS